MTNGTAPSAIAGDTLQEPSFFGGPLRFVFPSVLSDPGYSDLPQWWSWARDAKLIGTLDKEDMWAAAVARTATKFAAHGYVIKDSKDSQRRVSASQELLKRANGGEGWVPFALKVVQDLLTTDNGIFIRIRHANEKTERLKLKAVSSRPFYAGENPSEFADVVTTSAAPGAKVTGLYHLDSLRCTRTGNLTYPVRYQAYNGSFHLLRWDQVLSYADMPSPRQEMFGVGRCAASRAYKTISAVAALRQMLYEFVNGSGANKLAFVQGLSDSTLKNIIKAGELEQQAKGFLYYMGTILGAIPSDAPISIAEVLLKSLPDGFDWEKIIADAYLIYANAIGIPVQDIQPLSGQGLGTGTQTVILQEQAAGIGIAAFVKWWEQTVSDRVLPTTTELEFIDDNDMRDQEMKAKVRKLRGDDRAARIGSGEISPAMARQIALDDGDLSRDLVSGDATAGGQISDDEKPVGDGQVSPLALQLIQGEPTAPPKDAGMATKSVDDLFEQELASARRVAEAVRG
jgi:hypothetical protein